MSYAPAEPETVRMKSKRSDSSGKMKDIVKRLIGCLLAAVLAVPAASFGASPPQAKRMGDEVYKNVAYTYEANSCYSMQGMGVGEKYVYAIQIGDDNALAVVHRVEQATGKECLMRYGNTKRTVFRNFLHANDAEAVTIDGVEYLLVIADTKLIMMRVEDDALFEYGEFDITYNGRAYDPSGVAVIGTDGGKIRLLFKWVFNLTVGEIDRGATSGRIAVSPYGTLDLTKVPFDGRKIDFSPFIRQGCGYKNGVLFFPVMGYDEATMNAQSAIICFDVRNPSSGMQPIDGMTYYIESDAFSALFEIEDCGIGGDGRLYFNANRRVTSRDSNRDGVMVMRDLLFSGEGSGGCRHYRCAEKAEANYLAAPADCRSAARYYRCCEACGKAVSATFEAGEKDPHNHAGGTETRAGGTYCLGCGERLDETDAGETRRLMAAAALMAAAILRRGDLSLPVPAAEDLLPRIAP